MEFLTAVIPWILDHSVAPIRRHISYAVGFGSKVNTLHAEVRKLQIETNSLRSRIVDVQSRGEVVEAYVLEWQTRADQALEEAKSVIRIGDEEAQGSCSLGLCLSLKTRYRLGKKAEQGTPGIVQLLEDRDRFGPISSLPHLQQIVRPSVGEQEAHSRSKLLKNVMDALLDPNNTIVGVYGMGGIGKTTLAEEVHRQATQNKLFDKVVMARVTATPNLRMIQDEIAEFVVGSKLQESSDSARASRLYQSLKGRRVLIILDDLWSEIELDKVGVPVGNDIKGCKLLLTSRRFDLLSDKMGSVKNFPVQVLSEEESMSLFEKKVIKIRDREIAEKILVKCARFPLMIVTVAGLLKDKGLHVWNDILTRLSRFDHQEIHQKVYSILELSYNHLPDGDETKEIFLLCGICSQSYTTLQNLLSYSFGLGLFKHLTVSEAKDHLKTLIDHLKSYSLLDVDESGYMSMHDTVRDAAITIAHRDQRAFRPKDGNILNEWPSKDDLSGCTKVSIPYSNIRQLPEDLECPELEFVLLFFNRDTSFHIPDSTFQQTRQLKAVHFTRMRISTMPASLCFLTDLHTLCLENCWLPNIATIGQLKSLKSLSFRRSNLEALPIEIGQLTKLKLLDLSYCSKLHSIPVDVISKLSSLEELLLRNSFDNWEIGEHSSGTNARLSELKCLPKLVSLEICVPNTKALPKDFLSTRWERYQILIGKGWYFDDEFETTKILKSNLNTSSDLFQQVRELLKELESLHLAEIKGFTNLLYYNKGFPKLKKLCIRNSSDLQQIVDYGKGVGIVCFPLLESLRLEKLKSLVSICHGQPTPETFGKIKRLSISNCNKLKNLFSVSMVQSLSQMEKIKVNECNGMEALFVKENDCRYKGNEVVEFPQLRRLSLYSLPQLKCFLNARESLPASDRPSKNTIADTLMPFLNEKVALPNLEKLSLNSIGNIEMIWCDQPFQCALNKLNSLNIYKCNKLQKVFPSDALGSFQDLKSIKVRSCEGLKNLLPLVIANSLSQLSSLAVTNCGELEEIVAQEECLDNPPCFLFPQLASLTLEDLPKLRSLYPSSHTFSWPNLKQMEIRDCYKARIFGSFGELEASQRIGQPQFPQQPQSFFSMEKVFPNLEEMSIDGRIFESLSGSWLEYLTQLKSLELDSVREKSIAVFEFESIPNLRELRARNSHIKQLWRYEKSKFDHTDAPINFTQPSVRVLRLIDINGLKHVWRRGSQMDPFLPYLETLDLSNCGDLISLTASPFASFRCLSTLELWRCHKVTELIKPSTAKTMSNLVTLRICYCDALKEVVTAEEQQGSDHLPTRNECIVFDKLKYLELFNLESFEGFCTSSCYSFNFPCLEDVYVDDCLSMRIFCNGDLISPKLHYINWGLGHGQQCQADLNTTVRTLHESLQVKPSNISSLRISRFPQLVERWGRELPFKLSNQLSTLVVDKLALLPIAVPSNVLPSLGQLWTLIVEKCDSVEEIFDLDGMEQNEDQVGLMSSLLNLKLIELPKLRHIWNEDPLGILGFKHLRQLKICNCCNLTRVFSLPMALGLIHLSKLEVIECDLVEVIIKQEEDERPTEWDHHTLFPSLKSIELENLPSLMQFNSGRDVMRCPALNKVNVLGCPKICLFGSIQSSKEQDEKIMVQRSHNDGRVDKPTLCIFNKQVEIFNFKELGVQWVSSMDKAWHEIVPEPFLHSLQVIKLMGFPAIHELLPLDFVQGLPKLQRLIVSDSSYKQILPCGPRVFCAKLPIYYFAELKYLELFNLPELEYLVKENSQSDSLFHHLEILQVSKCSRLTWLLSSFMAKSLVNLKKMVVKECERMTEIVSSNKDGVGDEIVFDQLNSLELHDLPCLTCFSSKNYMFDFPLLDEVIIRKCSNMKTFAKNIPSTPVLDEVQIAEGEDGWHWEGALNSTIEKLFAEMFLAED